eukprot:6179877-Pleurochrysis_carterae.AAC.7
MRAPQLRAARSSIKQLVKQRLLQSQMPLAEAYMTNAPSTNMNSMHRGHGALAGKGSGFVRPPPPRSPDG